jgi:uncharacterized protein YjbJ (UPF0337 family)
LIAEIPKRSCTEFTAAAISLGIQKGDTMGQQEARGKVKKIQGRMKEAAGVITGNQELECEGSRQRAEGVVQESLGKARRKVGELVNEVAKAIKK